MRNFKKKQLHDWPLLAKNYANLRYLLLKSVFFDNFEVKIQFNSERIHSSAAKTDDLSTKVKAKSGVLGVARREDFDKMCRELLTDVYTQLTLDDETTTNTSRHIVCRRTTYSK